MLKYVISVAAGAGLAFGTVALLPTPVETIEVEKIREVVEYVDVVETVEVERVVEVPVEVPVTVVEYVEVPVYVDRVEYVEVAATPAEGAIDLAFERDIAACEGTYADDPYGLSDCLNATIVDHGMYE